MIKLLDKVMNFLADLGEARYQMLKQKKFEFWY